MARTRQARTIEDYLADVQDGIQRILAQFTPTNRLRIPTERLVNGIDGSLNNIRRLTGDLRQNHAQLNTRHNTLRQNFDNIRNERDALRAQTNLDQQNLNIFGQQNIILRRQLEEIEKSRNFWKLNAIYIKAQKDRHISDRLSSYLAGTGINPVGARDQAFGILRGCLSGRALEWFDRKILGKRWELHNIFANHGQAGMGNLRARTMAQMNTSNSFRNPSIAHDYANIAGNNAVTVGVSMIPAEAFTEDWRLAGGQPSDRPVNAINAGNNNPIVFGDIRIGQALYWLRTQYPTVISEKRNLVYGSLVQGSEPIGEFYSKLLKYGKMLNLDEQQIKGQFLRGLSPDLEDDAERIGQQTLKKPPGPGKRKADDLAIDRFLESLPDKTGLPGEDYDYDPVEDLRLQFEQLDINQAKLARVKLIELNKKLQLHINNPEKVANSDILCGIQNTLEKAKID
ncbi:16993_t:CDS:2 [Acaulospora colombiana]|uniref:16993_t:CDS:1 n=1 Tax=Acaulospora colombiana TaxID=27376 RepID=A0ACA9KKJ1_9GLOM|nr:16993_t:CDS:2 [Acaulospora colombiana]